MIGAEGQGSKNRGEMHLSSLRLKVWLASRQQWGVETQVPPLCLEALISEGQGPLTSFLPPGHWGQPDCLSDHNSEEELYMGSLLSSWAALCPWHWMTLLPANCPACWLAHSLPCSDLRSELTEF